MPTALTTADVERLQLALCDLLSHSTLGDAGQWSRGAALRLRDLIDADAAFVSLESATPSHASLGLPDHVVDAYQRHYARVDHGIARQRALRLELWTRHMLWSESELARSEYYGDFAVPNRLHDAMGIATQVAGGSVRVSLLYSSSAQGARGRRLRLLRLALPAFRAGAMLSARWRSRHDDITEVMDRVSQPLALCSASGQLLHENPALVYAAVLHDEVELRAAVRQAALAVAARRRLAPLRPDGVSMSRSRWRLVGTPVGGEEPDGAGPAVLVSLEPRAPVSVPPELLHARYALTHREVQVLELLRQRHSNAEIATILGISEHTARHHTEHVLAKLGETSRRRVAARYAQLGAEATTGPVRRPPAATPGVPGTRVLRPETAVR